MPFEKIAKNYQADKEKNKDNSPSPIKIVVWHDAAIAGRMQMHDDAIPRLRRWSICSPAHALNVRVSTE
jgi:hypothetical protein